MKHSVTSGLLAICGAVGSWATDHMAALVATGFAIVASVYSIMVSRATLRRGRAKDEEQCHICHVHPSQATCPYPIHERPEGCPFRYNRPGL